MESVGVVLLREPLMGLYNGFGYVRVILRVEVLLELCTSLFQSCKC